MKMSVKLPRAGCSVKALAALALCFVALCPNARAGSCASGSLASYILLGSGGCTIGTNLFFSFATLSGTAGAAEISPTLVSITPSGGTTDPELSFTVDANAGTGDLLESIFTYKLSGNQYLHSTIGLSGSSETVDGAVTDIQNLCEGGTFGPDGVSGCTGTADGLVTLDGFQNSDDTPLGSPSFVNVTDDFTVDGGTEGTASGGTFTDQFQAKAASAAVPEPGGTLPLGLSMLVLFVVWQKRDRSSESMK
jgi:hypothetical protein